MNTERPYYFVSHTEKWVYVLAFLVNPFKLWTSLPNYRGKDTFNPLLMKRHYWYVGGGGGGRT